MSLGGKKQNSPASASIGSEGKLMPPGLCYREDGEKERGRKKTGEREVGEEDWREGEKEGES